MTERSSGNGYYSHWGLPPLWSVYGFAFAAYGF